MKVRLIWGRAVFHICDCWWCLKLCKIIFFKYEKELAVQWILLIYALQNVAYHVTV